MQTIPQIDNPQEVQQAYAAMVRIYGKDIFAEPRRALGCLADMAPRLDREFENFSHALDLGIPALLQAAGGNGKSLKENGRQAVGLLSQRGLGEDEAIVMVENLGEALGLKIAIRPDYTKGGEIPYAPEERKSIREALDKMNHIRWFLNHQDNYQWKNGMDEITELRRMMSFPGKYQSQIEEKYKKLVHRFGNNPFEEHILLEGDPKAADFTSDSFADYFISIGDMPVPVSFAREYPDREVRDGNRSWDKKQAAFQDKTKKLADRISKLKPSGEAQTAKILASAGNKFVFWSILFIAVFLYGIKDMAAAGIDYLTFWEYTKVSGFNFIKMTKQLGEFRYAGNYYLYTAIALLGILITGLLLLSVVRTAVRTGKLKKGGAGQPKKQEKAMQLLQTEIPSMLDSMEKSMKEYLSKSKNKADFEKKDYRAVIEGAQGKAGNKPGNLKAPVSKCGRHLRRLLFVIAALTLYSVQNGAVSDCVNGSQELAGAMASGSMPTAGDMGNVMEGGTGLAEAADADLSQYLQLPVADATQSSNVNSSSGNNYTVWEALDNNPETSWQEGVSGNGAGEYMLMTFDQEYLVEYMVLRLGNWRNSGFSENNRPAVLTFRTGGAEYSYSFPDEQREFVLKLGAPVIASDLLITIQEVYQGSRWDDTCISDVLVYGSVPTEESAAMVVEEETPAAQEAPASENKEKTWSGRVSRKKQNRFISPGETLDQNAMVPYLTANAATRAAYVLDIGNRKEYGIENSDEPMPASALIGIPIMFTVASEANKGNLNLDEMAVFSYTFSGRGNLKQDSSGQTFSVIYLLEQALQYSDNNAINSLIDYLGLERINQVCHEYGFTSVDMQRKIVSGSTDLENYISAKDAAMMLNAVYQNNFDRIGRDFLKQNFRIPESDSSNGGMYNSGRYYPDFLNLNGVTETRYNEVGLFEDGEKVFIISILTANGQHAASMDMVSRLTEYITSTL